MQMQNYKTSTRKHKKNSTWPVSIKKKNKPLSRTLLKTALQMDTANKKRETRNFGENIYRTLTW